MNYLACNRPETFRGFRGIHARQERESSRAESLSILNPSPNENKNQQELTSTKNFVDSSRSALVKICLRFFDNLQYTFVFVWHPPVVTSNRFWISGDLSEYVVFKGQAVGNLNSPNNYYANSSIDKTSM